MPKVTVARGRSSNCNRVHKGTERSVSCREETIFAGEDVQIYHCNSSLRLHVVCGGRWSRSLAERAFLACGVLESIVKGLKRENCTHKRLCSASTGRVNAYFVRHLERLALWVGVPLSRQQKLSYDSTRSVRHLRLSRSWTVSFTLSVESIPLSLKFIYSIRQKIVYTRKNGSFLYIL